MNIIYVIYEIHFSESDTNFWIRGGFNNVESALLRAKELNEDPPSNSEFVVRVEEVSEDEEA